jgi:hypothetical protein
MQKDDRTIRVEPLRDEVLHIGLFYMVLAVGIVLEESRPREGDSS